MIELLATLTGGAMYTLFRGCNEDTIFSFGMAVSAAFATMIFLVQ